MIKDETQIDDLNFKPKLTEAVSQFTTEPATNITNVPLTEKVYLPSQGKLYSSDSPLALGYVEMKYMTTKEEDILTTVSYMKDGTVLDKLFQSMIVTKFNYDDLLLGDRNAIMIAARIYGYGPEYNTKINTASGIQEVSIDLQTIINKEVKLENLNSNGNFEFVLPKSKKKIEFKLLTVGMQKQIDKSLAKVKSIGETEQGLTTRLRYMIQSVDGVNDPSVVIPFINSMLAVDSRAFREYIKNIQPDVDLNISIVDEATGIPFRTEFPLGLDLFWPDFKG
jgi:hypothetical protein